MRVETRFALNCSEGADKYCSAGPARPVSSPAASLTAGYDLRPVVRCLELSVSLRRVQVPVRFQHDGTSGILAGHKRSNQQGRPAAPDGNQNPVDGSRSGIQFGRKHSNLDADVVPLCFAVGSMVGLRRSRWSAIPISSWGYCPRTGIENADPLALAAIDRSAVAV